VLEGYFGHFESRGNFVILPRIFFLVLSESGYFTKLLESVVIYLLPIDDRCYYILPLSE
jgi:hypothetical protein